MGNRIKHFSLPFKSIVILLSLVLLIGQIGCTDRYQLQLPPPPSEDVRSKFGTIGVVSARFQPKVELLKPMGKGAAAAHGALEGFLGTFSGGTGGSAGSSGYGGAALGVLVMLALAPVFAVGGGITGAVSRWRDNRGSERNTCREIEGSRDRDQ